MPIAPAPNATADRPAGVAGALQRLRNLLGRDFVGVILLGAAVACGLSLVTFDVADVSGLSWPTNETPHNVFGGFGSWLGSQLLYWLGLAAFAVPVVLLAAGATWLLLPATGAMPDDENDARPATGGARRLFWRSLGATGVVLAAAALLGDAMPPLPGAPAAGGVLGLSLHHLVGGFVGMAIARWMILLLVAGALVMALGDLPRRILDALGAAPAFDEDAFDAFDHDDDHEQNRDPGASSIHDAETVQVPARRKNAMVREQKAKQAVAAAASQRLAAIATEQKQTGDAPTTASAPKADAKKRSIFEKITGLIPRRKEPKENVPDHALLTADDLAATPEPKPKRARKSQRQPAIHPSQRQAAVAADAQPAEAKSANKTTAAAASPPASRKDGRYMIPPPELLTAAPAIDPSLLDGQAHEMARRLQEVLGQFKVEATVCGIDRGPTVTLYEIELPPGTKVKKLTSLEHDLSMALRVESVRVVAPIPGRGGIGLEIPNLDCEPVNLRELFTNNEAQRMARDYTLPFVVGRDSVGRPVIADLADMPHLLIAGTTGSGKSVAANALVLSTLFTRHYDDVKMVVIDPKMVEFAAYRDIPHLMLPIVTDNREAAGVLSYLVDEMERRYRILERTLCKHIKEFNELSPDERLRRVTASLPQKPDDGTAEEPLPERLPYIVALVDELADLMMVAGKEVEGHICRLAQKSRAVGIHLVLATQRPSVDVITGLIKANIPSRLSFRVLSGIDSKTILDRPGGERLLGRGDALFLPAGRLDLVRCQGAFVSNSDILKVTHFIKAQARAEYIELPTAYVDDDEDEDDDAPRRRRKRKQPKKGKKGAKRRKQMEIDDAPGPSESRRSTPRHAMKMPPMSERVASAADVSIYDETIDDDRVTDDTIVITRPARRKKK